MFFLCGWKYLPVTLYRKSWQCLIAAGSRKCRNSRYSPVAPQLIPFSWILLYTTGKRKTTTAANGGRPLAAGRYAAVHELDINYNLTKQMYWGLCDGDTSRN